MIAAGACELWTAFMSAGVATSDRRPVKCDSFVRSVRRPSLNLILKANERGRAPQWVDTAYSDAATLVADDQKKRGDLSISVHGWRSLMWLVPLKAAAAGEPPGTASPWA
jgi:hypothetical protein